MLQQHDTLKTNNNDWYRVACLVSFAFGIILEFKLVTSLFWGYSTVFFCFTGVVLFCFQLCFKKNNKWLMLFGFLFFGLAVSSKKIWQAKNTSVKYYKEANIVGTVKQKRLSNKSTLVLKNVTANGDNINGDVSISLWRFNMPFLISTGDVISFTGDIWPKRHNAFYSSYPALAFFTNLPPIGGKIINGLERDVKSDNGIKSFASKIRIYASERIDMSYGPSDGKSIVKAIILGDSSEMDPISKENMRYSGLSHLLAISGLHLSIIAGGVFLVVRKALVFVLLKFFPKVFYKINIKAIAATIGIMAGGFYLSVADFPVSGIRSLIGFTVLMITFIAGKRVTPLNTWTLAAFVMLFASPQLLFFAGFQMSFMATFFLINGFAKIKNLRLGKNYFINKIVTIVLSSGLATFPIAFIEIYHFSYFSLAGLLANLAAIPSVEIIGLPSAFFGLLLSATGADIVLYSFSNYAVYFVALVAKFFAGFPFSRINIYGMGGYHFLLTMIGCTVVFNKSKIGWGLMFVGIVSFVFTGLPQLIWDSKDQVIAIKTSMQKYKLFIDKAKMRRVAIINKFGKMMTFSDEYTSRTTRGANYQIDCIKNDWCNVDEFMEQNTNGVYVLLTGGELVFLPSLTMSQLLRVPNGKINLGKHTKDYVFSKATFKPF